VSKISKVVLTRESGSEAATRFTMTCGTTDYPFRADTPEEAAAWVAIIQKRMRSPNP
jgi:hypothetical protein